MANILGKKGLVTFADETVHVVRYEATTPEGEEIGFFKAISEHIDEYHPLLTRSGQPPDELFFTDYPACQQFDSSLRFGWTLEAEQYSIRYQELQEAIQALEALGYHVRRIELDILPAWDWYGQVAWRQA